MFDPTTAKKAPKRRKQNLGHNPIVTHESDAETAAAGQEDRLTQSRHANGGANSNPQAVSPLSPRDDVPESAAGHGQSAHQAALAGSGHFDQIVAEIRDQCRWRRYWMKVQHKLDRALESQIRRMETGWAPDLSDREREKFNKEALAIIAKARKGEGKSHIVSAVLNTDKAREPADKLEAEHKDAAARLAKQLPVYEWVESVKGAGEGGLATIVGEAGDLTDYGHPHPSTEDNPYEGPQGYTNPAKVWKRLGFAPYDGFAGSTWKRDSWRPRDLTKQEWIDNPFSGARYALMYSLADSMLRQQKEGRDKELERQQKQGLIPKDACLYRSGQKYGEPKGAFGEVYVKRRLHTDETHPEWSAGHSHADALRVMFKEFLKQLWREWNRIESERRG